MKFKLFALLLITAFIKCDSEQLTEAQKLAAAKAQAQLLAAAKAQAQLQHTQAEGISWEDVLRTMGT